MGQLHIVGLGSGDAGQLTLAAWNAMKDAEALVLRTADHPVADWLERNGIAYTSFDAIYASSSTFAEAYDRIASECIRMARASAGTVVYAVPDHPSVAEATVRLLKERCPREGVDLAVTGGESFLDQAFLRLGFDPIDGFLLLDAEGLSADRLQPQVHTIVTQIYDAFTASDVKLALLEWYPPEHRIVFARSLGVAGAEEVREIPVVELDRQPHYGNHTLVWIPKNDDDRLRIRTFERLRDIVRILRSPEGCPWDREQTHTSIRRHLIEETCEVLETIDNDDPEAMCEELGDLLLQIMLHAQMEAEAGAFDIGDVLQGLNEKLIRRHPHVFGDIRADDAGEALRNWDRIKAEEKKAKGAAKAEADSLLDGVPPALTALMTAWEYQKRAAKVGFDWEHAAGALDKVAEELEELRRALRAEEPKERLEDELGDLLFAAVNAARKLNVDPERALAMTNRKFRRRFRHVERRCKEAGRRLQDCTLDEMERWWQEAKLAPPAGK